MAEATVPLPSAICLLPSTVFGCLLSAVSAAGPPAML